MFLAIDTSGKQTSVALVDPDALHAQSFVSIKNSDSVQVDDLIKSHSSSLSCLVDSFLSEKNLSVSNITAIILGAGPGSFTGLRIGFAFAKGLAISMRLPILTLSSLSAAAWQFRDKGDLVLALDDARRNEFFAASYENNCGSFNANMPDKILGFEEVQAWQTDNPAGLIVSSNPDVIESFPKALLAKNLALALAQQALESGLIDRDCLILGNKRWDCAGLAAITPTYVRAVSAMTIAERAKN